MIADGPVRTVDEWGLLCPDAQDCGIANRFVVVMSTHRITRIERGIAVHRPPRRRERLGHPRSP